MSKQLIDARPVTFGPLEPSTLSLRGIRFFSDEHGAGGDGANGDGEQGGSGGDEGQGSGSSNSSGGDGSNSNDGGNGNQGQGQQRPAPTPRNRQQTFSPEYVTELRNENATRRKNETALTTRAETAEKERDTDRAELAQLKRERTIEKHAEKAGANPSALLDSTAFATATKDLDLSDADAVEKAIKDFVEKNPHVAANPSGPGSSGPGRPGGSSQERVDNSNNLAGAVGAALSGQSGR